MILTLEGSHMNVLQISTHAGTGPGGVMGGYRLYKGLIDNQINCRILAGTVTEPSKNFSATGHNTLPEKLLSRLTIPLGLNYIHYLSSFKLNKHPFFKEADVVNYHSIHSGYFSYLALSKLSKLKPSVYTLHDMWSFTGHCANSRDCERWKTGCGKCPYPTTFPAIAKDNTALEWKIKKWVYERSEINIVTPSTWMKSNVEQSILQKFNVYHIPNGIDLNAFQARDPDSCRKILNIEKDKFVVMFTAYDLSKRLKGSETVIDIINSLPESIRQNIVLLMMGFNGSYIQSKVSVKCVDLGFISGDEMKSFAFSTADVLLYPTEADNLPYIVQESIACGTPVLSYKVGGVPELVKENESGLTVPAGNKDAMKKQLEYMYENKDALFSLRQKCRKMAIREFGIDLQVMRYMELYKEILEEKHSHA